MLVAGERATLKTVRGKDSTGTAACRIVVLWIVVAVEDGYSVKTRGGRSGDFPNLMGFAEF